MVALERQLAVANDDVQQIIEIVRDPAGELADGFHLLRLPQLLLNALLLERLAHDSSDRLDQLPLFVQERTFILRRARLNIEDFDLPALFSRDSQVRRLPPL